MGCIQAERMTCCLAFQKPTLSTCPKNIEFLCQYFDNNETINNLEGHLTCKIMQI